jgi:hypothetical protein
MSALNSTVVRVGGFVAGLAVVLGGAYAVGDAVGPVANDEPAEASHDDDGGHGDSSEAAGVETSIPAGLQVTENGYTLVPEGGPYLPGVEQDVSLRIVGPDGHPVTEFDESHDKDLHLIVVRRDLAGFQHVHPTMAPDGTWTVPMTFPDAGAYRMFADFQPTGTDGLTLGADIDVTGDLQHTPLPEPARTAEVDGYEVTLDGELVPGESSRLTLSVSKDGRPVTDLEPYLAAYGHLVVLRAGDLGYLHVHPDGEPGDGRTQPGPEVVFYAEVPSTGTYRLYLDFAHDGVVRTAEFTATATDADHDDVSDDEHDSEEGR